MIDIVYQNGIFKSNNKGDFLKKFDIILSVFWVLIVISIISQPERFISASLNGISAWAFNVLPCVLPFMIISKLLLNLPPIEAVSKKIFSPMGKIYGTSSMSGYCFFMSIISGYPVGSKIILDLHNQGKITRQDACRMSSFCSNSGPMFIIGSVGCIFLKDYTAGILIFISHVLSALINGLIYRGLLMKSFQENIINSTKTKKDSFAEIVYSSIQASLTVGAIICLFFIVIEWFVPFLSIFPLGIRGLLEGMIEITKGSITLSTLNSKIMSIGFLSFVITFGGISTVLQSMSFLKKAGVSSPLFILQKFSQAIIALVISTIFAVVFY